MKLSYCVVNTNGREDLLACLGAIARTHPDRIEAEILVLDNASEDDSAAAAATWFKGDEFSGPTRLIAVERRTGKAANDSQLLHQASGEYCLLLNEDSELRRGAAAALLGALDADPGAAIAGAQLFDPAGDPQPCAWRLPGLLSSLAGALFLHRLVVTEGDRAATSEVGWVQSAAMLVRRAAAEAVGYLDSDFFVYSDETDFAKRLRDAGWRVLHVPAAQAVHHEQLASDLAGERRRIVEFHRGRDLYMRKHHSRPLAALARLLAAWSYLPRMLVALVLPGHEPRRYAIHAAAALRPQRGSGLRESAEEFNRRREMTALRG